MKKLIAALGVVLLMWPLTALAGPKLKIDSTRLDLGAMLQASSVQGVYEIENVGDADLQIKRVTPG